MLPAIAVHMTHQWLRGQRVVPHICTLRQLPELDRATFFLAFVPAFNRWLQTDEWN